MLNFPNRSGFFKDQSTGYDRGVCRHSLRWIGRSHDTDARCDPVAAHRSSAHHCFPDQHPRHTRSGTNYGWRTANPSANAPSHCNLRSRTDAGQHTSAHAIRHSGADADRYPHPGADLHPRANTN